MKSRNVSLICAALTAGCLSTGAMADINLALPTGGSVHLERLGATPTNVGLDINVPLPLLGVHGTLFEPGQPGKRVIKDLDIYVLQGHLVNIHH